MNDGLTEQLRLSRRGLANAADRLVRARNELVAAAEDFERAREDYVVKLAATAEDTAQHVREASTCVELANALAGEQRLRNAAKETP